MAFPDRARKIRVDGCNAGTNSKSSSSGPRPASDPTASAQTGKTLTVVLGGGTLRLPSGEIVQRNLDLGDYGIQPDHRYLAFLGYEKDGEYFSWLKSWDLSSGVAVPTYPFDIQKAKDGTSRFAGMPADNFVAAVRRILSPGAR